MTEPKPCTRKGCKAIAIHRHLLASGKKANGTTWDRWSDDALPRLTRKALRARIAALEAENADLHAEIADKADRLARAEKAQPESLANLASNALRAAILRGDANDATQYVRILDTIVQDGLNNLTPAGDVPF